VALLQKIPMPTASIAMFPSQTYGGICGIVSSFWATGYDGRPIQWSGPTAGGGVVEVLATPQGFDWDFGDGFRVESSGPGVAWPQLNGAVTHMYRVKSKAAGFATGAVNSGQGGYPVNLTVTFNVVWRLNGGAWQSGLAPIQRSISANYPVYEVRGEEVPNFAAAG
jgi:hypothetical protein